MVYLSAIAYVHGEPEPLAELEESVPVALLAPDQGLSTYRKSALETWNLAALASEKTCDIAHTLPQLLIYTTESDPTMTESLPRITQHLNLPNTKYMAISGHACGNLGPALDVTQGVMAQNGLNRVLLVTADRALGRSRLLSTGLSVFSDGGASCLITREPPNNVDHHFAIRSVVTRTATDTDFEDPSGFMLSAVALGRACTEATLTLGHCTRADYRHVMFGNYRVGSQQFLTAAIGFPVEKLLLGPIGEYAHSFSADILMNLDLFASSGALQSGDRIVVSAIGVYSWSMLDVEYRHS